MKKSSIFRVSLLLLVILACTGCDYQLIKAKSPENLIPKDTFRYVLHDLMVVESYYKIHEMERTDFYHQLPQVVDTIFQKYGIDSLQFSRSMNYYSKHQKEMVAIYSKIQDSITLNTVEATLNKEK